MKQKLSLIAVAFIAVCAFAAQAVLKADPAPMSNDVVKAAPQKRAAVEPEIILFSPDAVAIKNQVDATVFYTDNQVIEGTDVSITLGNDQDAASYKVETPNINADAFPDFVQDNVPVWNDDESVVEMKTRAISIHGNQNPKDKTGKNSGSGFNATEGKATANLPQSGTYFIFDVAKAGTLKVGIVLNSGKAFYIVDATNAYTEPIAEGSEETYLKVALPDANIKHDKYVIENKDGVVEVSDASDGKGGGEVADKVEGTVTFDVEAGHKYYIFCTGSKLGCFGCMFTPAAAAEPEDITISPESGDISAALAEASEGKTVGNITINLTEGASYNVSSTITAPASLTINGNGATIDASALEGNMIEQPVADESVTSWEGIPVVDVNISNVTVKGLKKAMILSPKYNVLTFTLDNSIVELAADATTFDFTKGGFVSDFTITNSTIYAPTATGKSLWSTQQGTKASEISAEQKQNITIKNSTLYNLAKGKNFFSHRTNGQAYLVFDIEDNIFVNCGKSGQVVRGLNGGQASANPTWTVKGNVFNFDDADTSAAEGTGDEAEPVQDSVAGVVKFFNPANGNFNGKFYAETAPGAVGDPRWTLTTEVAPTDITISPADGDIYAALVAAEEGIAKVGNITINLTEGANYTISNTIAIPANLTINGNGANIDATALEANMIEQPNTSEVEGAAWDATIPVKVLIKGIKVKGLAKTLFYSPKFNVVDFTLDNSVIELTADVIGFDFTKGGIATDFTITNSTIYAPTATKKSLYSSQSGTKVTEFGANQKQTFTIKNNTMYNITKGANFFTHRQANQKFFVYDIENNIFVDCGKSGQVVKGINQGQSGTNPTWIVKGNVFNFEGADTSADEATGDEEEPVQNSIEGVVEFTDAEGGDFNGSFGYSGETTPASIGGDPRWTFTFEKVYKVNIVAENGQVILEKATYKEGEKVYADVKANDGYEVVSVMIVNDATGEEIQPVEEEIDGQEKHYFVMPASSVTITAVFAKLYDVTVAATENGSITVISVNMESEPYAKAGKKICLMVKPGDDYEVSAVTVKTADDQDVTVTAETGTEHGQEYNYYFIMPESAVTISATFQIIDGIDTITADGQNGKWYNLQGVEVQKPVKGVFIQNGKKVIVK